MMANISDLTPIAKQLNEKTDEINKTISTINEKLARLNFGIEVWLDNPWNALSSSTRDQGKTRVRDVSYLGYDRLGDKWQLAIKDVEEEITLDENGDECVEQLNPEYVALLQASRDLRLAALKKLPELLDELKIRGQHILNTIADAEQLAESL